LQFLAVAARATGRASETEDAISDDAVSHALAGLAAVLEHVRERTEGVNEHASALYRTLRSKEA
jgi:hypothetical protein